MTTKTLTPNDILDFGKNKGVKLSLVYKYQPSYIEWAIENIPDFKIDIAEFEKLPSPTPGNYNKESFSHDKINKTQEDLTDDDFFQLLLRSDTANQLKSINVLEWEKMEIENGVKFESIEYNFPQRIKLLNNRK